MLFDSLFGLLTPGLALGLLVGIVAFFTGVTALYVRYERTGGRCLMTYEQTHH